MRKQLAAGLLAFTLLLQTTSFATAAVAPGNDEKGYISVRAEKSEEIMPDTAKITLTAETTDKQSNVAALKNKEIMNKAQAEILKLKTDANKLEMYTSGYSLRTNYTYNRNNVRSTTGYTVENSVTVKTKDIQNAGKIIDTALKAGVTRIGNIEFSYDRNSLKCNDMLSAATKSAYETARSSAASIKGEIKGIKSINTSCRVEGSTLRNFPVRMYSKALSADAEAASAEPETIVSPGKMKIYASVDATFYVK